MTGGNLDFQKFLNDFLTVTKNHYGNRLDKIILYGSYARGEQTDESDVDFMILLKDKQVKAPEEILKFGKEVYGIGWKYGHFISILPTSSVKYIESMLPVYQNARSEGITLQ